MKINKTLVFIPTLNEEKNVKIIYEKIKLLKINVDYLFIDDDSSDGTLEILKELSSKDKRLSFIHRTNNKGIGSAHVEGIKYAYKNSYEMIITMDCDLSHSPQDIIKFINASKKGDIIIGTRFKNKKSIEDWNFYRKSLTRLGNIATLFFLGLNFDTTGAFRLYNLRKINHNFLNLITFNRYSFFFESLYILNLNKYKIVEIPINLPSRVYGESKQTFKDIFIGFKNLLLIFYRRLFNKKKYIINYEKK